MSPHSRSVVPLQPTAHSGDVADIVDPPRVWIPFQPSGCFATIVNPPHVWRLFQATTPSGGIAVIVDPTRYGQPREFRAPNIYETLRLSLG